MPTNPGVSEVQDKNGVVADIEAKRFDGTRTVQIQGDVTATQTWNGDSSSPLTLNASIGAKKVTQDKIGDKAVGSGQMADGSVGLTQMAASAMTDTVSANNSKLVTSQGVNAAIAAATLNRGKDYGPMSVDEINAISETIPTGSTVYVESLGASDAKVINDGYSDGTMASFSVEVGEDLKYYRSPDNSLHGWYSTEANVKIKQPANYAGGIAVDSAQDASSGTAGIEFIQSFKQDTNGNIRDIVKAQVDIVDSTSSTRTNAAATPNSVKEAYDLANTANTGLANKLDKTGDGKDVTATFTEASSRENIGTDEKLSVMFGKIKKWFTDLKALAFKDTVSDSDISGTISDSHIASASTWNGKADKVSGATNGNLAALDSNGNLTDSGKKASDFELVTNKVTSWQGTPDNTHYPSEKLVKDSLDAKFGFARISSQSSIDLNNFNTTSFYELNAPSFDNSPVASNQLTLLVMDSRGRKFQMLMSGDESGGTNNVYLFIRKKTVSSWGSWVELANTSAVDAKQDKPSSATEDNIATFNGTKSTKDSGKSFLTSTSTWDGTSDAKVPTAKAVQAKLDGKVNNSDIAKMVQVETAGTAVGSNLQPVFVNGSGVATPIEFRTWISNRGSGISVSALPIGWYKADGNLPLTPGDTPFYIELSGLDDFGFIDLWINQFYNNSPLLIHVQANVFASGLKGLKILERNGYDTKNIDKVILRTNQLFTETKIYFHVTRNDNYFRWRSSAGISNSNFAILTEAQYNALTTVIRDTVLVPDVGSCAMSKRVIQRGEYNVVDTGDLATTTDAGIVKFMTTTEATAIWDRAWAAATPS